ncbi:MAG: type II CRISPR RNA-guided endonuclease Cas9 [Zetaproteobacteria bacterium CG_4_9_14_3_um_filter_49_83]|nr:MAG: type II CRISPR RNA-guided endonuclease Cas9 [Zetaproteobacteria bacterium CG1_02_49_23]PIQ33968.1 MAG: type II CRISPR RNA-guided endonuclease Cas9 [Zetaproteobacteria bacterium CG17_big_fil_post_rev_8_21_14_2_50_50_13]PIV30766.1 MAG: type II CRISPR RNA-guided endonuclease Cas9 [Zetaproteobacteria bacterium CG02_land_8_20_14_3_00_50_9]PIY56749.1 MAG: type II CRISPR RNA-guided endonuclease Cas9 [Zetaproteobacteria bacterium CG_4_10_14_0_8_um_filter_49_80]PJA35969.1 MAG: type II CRISPR RNA
MTVKPENINKENPITFGLDIGIASVGWAVLGENRIIDLGVRCFDKAETAKEGESLNLSRRMARLMRRRLRRRAWRLTKLVNLLKREGLIEDVNVLKQQPFKGFQTPNLWQLRVNGLDRKLGNEEWARVIYHLCKHRGFHWISKAEAKAADSDKEGGKVKQGLAGTKRLMQEKSYRTAAEMVLAEFPDAQRNKQGEYSKALSRELLCEEMKELFKQQRAFGNAHADEKLEAAILGNSDKKSGLFWAQKPSLSGEALLKMLGKCTFEKNEYRAAKASFTVERHVLLTRINNLRIVEDGKIRGLTADEQRIALWQPYQQAGDFKYKQLGSALVKAGYLVKDGYKFAGLAYPSEVQKAEKAKDPEDTVLVKLPAWQMLKKTLKDAGLESDWQEMADHALNGKPDLLDQIGWVLSVYKEEDEVERELGKLQLSTQVVEALQTVRFDKFSNLSLAALRKIIPHMENGMRYDEACVEAGYHHSLPDLEDDKAKEKYLPSFYAGRDKEGRLIFNEEMDIPRNPVVLRALNQTRKVVNALIHKFGSPHSVHIEMARDLSKPFDERRKIERDQLEYRSRNESDRATFAGHFNIMGRPKGRDFEKWQLYREQQGKCAYSLDPIDLNRLLEKGYVEVDHALPYSRSFDDSKNNRVLVLTRENRNKGNQTPYEYLDGKGNSDRWLQFESFVKTNKAYRQAKQNRLLKKDFGEKETRDFRERNLNDTRYICRFFKNYVEQYLQLHEESDAKRCVVVSGQLTTLLRVRWGLLKVRGDSDRHHALDAAVVAACSHGMVKRMSDYAQRKELGQVRDRIEKVDTKTGEILDHFPSPWPHFRDELLSRLNLDDPAALHAAVERLETYPPEALESIKPLFVSRAPQRRNSGAAHKETIYAQPEALKEKGSVTQKVAVTNLKPADVDKLVDPERNVKLYSYLRKWLEGKEEREKQAKAIEASAGRGKERRELTAEEKSEIEKLRALPRKPDKQGNPTGPIVRTVTMVIGKLSGIPVRGGIAKNDSMLRVDLFRHKTNGKFHLVPVYVHHTVSKLLPNRAIVQSKDEEEWTEMDDNFEFLYSLHPNDLVQISQKKKESIMGYYSGCDRATGNLAVWSHDRNQQVGKDGLIRGIGIKTAQNVEKFNVDVLGNIYPALPETRRELA